jgi:hypothetical protein
MPAFNLSKQDAERRDGYLNDLRTHAAQIEDALSEYNATVATALPALQSAVDDYNNTLALARGWCEDIATAAEDAIDAKSEKWQAGENGQAAIEYRDHWQGIALDDLEVEWPEPFEIETPNHADDLEALPSEAMS